jgi:transcriptional regulator with XRE-family HTH domain
MTLILIKSGKIGKSNMMINFSEHLRFIRNKSHKTQKQVAEYLDISESNYRKYELGSHLPGFENLIKLSEYFSVNLDYLMTGKL